MDTISQHTDIIIAALAVVALLILALFIWRSFSQRTRGRRGQRLAISEYQELDQTRRLVLVRRDNVEHLVLIGGPTDIVVESGIGVAAFPTYAPASEQPAETAGRPIAMRSAPRAPVFGDRRPRALRTVEREEPPLSVPRERDHED
jgi:Meckel syndrome type 1 protein